MSSDVLSPTQERFCEHTETYNVWETTCYIAVALTVLSSNHVRSILQTWSLDKAVVEARCRDASSVYGACLTVFKKGIIQKRVYPVAFDAKKGNVFLALGRGAVRALNTSKTRSSASAPRPRCLGSIPDHFFPFSKVLLGRTAAPKMRACTSTLFCK